MARRPRRAARFLLLALVVVGGALPAAADARPKVVVDADMSFDDAATLAYLARADRRGVIDLDAVTVSLSGAGYPGRGLGHARCLLRKHGLPGVPVSDGDRLGANALPEAIRSYVDAVTGRVVTYERTRLSVVQSGVEAGRTVLDPRGARVHLGVAADAQAFENHFLAVLNGP